jgi:hypothetical protein
VSVTRRAAAALVVGKIRTLPSLTYAVSPIAPVAIPRNTGTNAAWVQVVRATRSRSP